MTPPAEAQIALAEGVDEFLMVAGAHHVLGLASQCTSMFLRMSPIPMGAFEVTSADLSVGLATVTLVTDAPFDNGQSEMTVVLNDEGDEASLECDGTARVEEGSQDLVWGALHRHSRGFGALTWGANIGEAPGVITMDTCIEDFPNRYAVTEWQVRLERGEMPDEVFFRVSGSRNSWGDGCLELE